MLFGAISTVLVAVLTDAVATERPIHTATLAALAIVVAALRLKLADRQSGLFGAASGAIVAQPALHAALKLVPQSAADTAPQSGHVDASISLAHIVVAALIVLVVAGGEQLFLLVALRTPLVRWLRLLMSSTRHPAAPVVPAVAPSAMLATRWLHIAHVTRRGPPMVDRAATA